MFGLHRNHRCIKSQVGGHSIGDARLDVIGVHRPPELGVEIGVDGRRFVDFGGEEIGAVGPLGGACLAFGWEGSGLRKEEFLGNPHACVVGGLEEERADAARGIAPVCTFSPPTGDFRYIFSWILVF